MSHYLIHHITLLLTAHCHLEVKHVEKIKAPPRFEYQFEYEYIFTHNVRQEQLICWLKTQT